MNVAGESRGKHCGVLGGKGTNTPQTWQDSTMIGPKTLLCFVPKMRRYHSIIITFHHTSSQGTL